MAALGPARHVLLARHPRSDALRREYVYQTRKGILATISELNKRSARQRARRAASGPTSSMTPCAAARAN